MASLHRHLRGGLKVQPALRDRQGLLVRLGHKAFKVHKVPSGHKVLLALAGKPVRSAPRDR